MENLRKVKFTLEGQDDLGLKDYENDAEQERTTKERDGQFHTWGNECFWNDGKLIEQVIGVVEEIETGKVYHIIPKRITFVPSDSSHLV